MHANHHRIFQFHYIRSRQAPPMNSQGRCLLEGIKCEKRPDRLWEDQPDLTHGMQVLWTEQWIFAAAAVCTGLGQGSMGVLQILYDLKVLGALGFTLAAFDAGCGIFTVLLQAAVSTFGFCQGAVD